jgi:cystathionine beta-lyase
MKQEGTYLAWLDITALGMTSDALTDHLLKHSKLLVNSGTMYGTEAGEGYIRLNLACPRERLLDGLLRLSKSLKK